MKIQNLKQIAIILNIKLMLIIILCLWKKKFKLFATTAILFNHDSKYRNSKFLFPRLAGYLKNQRLNLIKEIYEQNIIGDFSHAEDICWAIYLIIKKQISVKNIILSSGKKTRVNLLIKFLINKYNLGIKIKIKQKKNNIYLIGNNKLAKKLLKWKPKKTIYDAVKEIYKAI